jgi:hypothetical protein
MDAVGEGRGAMYEWQFHLGRHWASRFGLRGINIFINIIICL